MAPLIRMPLGVVASGWGKNTLDHFEGFGPCNGSEEQGVCLRTVGSGSFTHSCAIIKQTSGTAKTIDCQPSGEDINMMRFPFLAAKPGGLEKVQGRTLRYGQNTTIALMAASASCLFSYSMKA